MTLALSEGGLVHTHAEMERAFQRQPEGPTKFQTPRRRQSTSPRPNPTNDTESVRQSTPLPQHEQRLFGPYSENQVFAATARLEQFGRLVLDIYGGPCLNSRATEVIEEFVPFARISCGQSGFDRMMEEVVFRYAPLVEPDEAERIIEKALLDTPSFRSPAIGKRWGVTAEQYDRLALTHITPAEWGPRKLKNQRKKRRNKRVKEQRHAGGESKTRRELSIAQLQPWTFPWAPCSSRAEFYRLPKAERDALVARARTEATLRR